MSRAPISLSLLAGLLSAGCASAPDPVGPFPDTAFRQFSPVDAPLLLAPGDTIEVNVPTAPELNRTVTVGPDGRVRLSLGLPVMAAGATPEDVEAGFGIALQGELREPIVRVLPVEYAPGQVFIGGEVGNPGMFALPGQIDPLQAIIMAGGFTDRARTRHVLVLRRLPGGEVRSAVFDLKAGLEDARLAQWGPLQRFDVVYVSRSPIAEQNLFVQQYVRDALPLDFQFFYDVRGDT